MEIMSVDHSKNGGRSWQSVQPQSHRRRIPDRSSWAEHTDDDISAFRVFVVLEARMKPFTTKSDFARIAANEVAICASEG